MTPIDLLNTGCHKPSICKNFKIHEGNKVKYNKMRYACTEIFIVVLFIIAPKWKQLQNPSTDEWNKIWYTHTVEYYLAIKRNKVLIYVTAWINLENIMLCERNQS